MLKVLTIPLCFTFLLHGFVLAILIMDWSVDDRVIKREIPKHIKATLVTLEKKQTTSKTKPKVKKKQKPKPKPIKKAEPDKSQAIARDAKVREREKQRQDEKRRQDKARLDAQRRQTVAEQELADAIAKETEAQQAEDDTELASSYVASLTQAIERQWSRPASARNNMQVELILDLLPTGDVIGVAVVKSSGDAAFDRSAVNAVNKAARFPELQSLPNRVFEKNFRRLRMIFRPEDLRR